MKLVAKRGVNESMAKVAVAFLTALDVGVLIMGCMMADAANEIMELIRQLDTEQVNIACINNLLRHHLDNCVWLFFERGVFEIHGHTSFMMGWLEKVHYYTLGKETKLIGGSAPSAALLESCLKEMQAWVHLLSHAMKAEFPAFSLVSCFSVFELPRESQRSSCNATSTNKLNRLSQMLSVPACILIALFKRFWHHAHLVYQQSDFKLDYWGAWREGIHNCGGDSDPTVVKTILHVIKRGQVFAPATSGVEQSFSLVASLLGNNRLNASDPVENMYINLLVGSWKAAQLDDLVKRSIGIWRDSFQKHSRMHVAPRTDRGVKREAEPQLPQGSEKCNERKFFKRLTSEVNAHATPNAADVFAEELAAVPVMWTPQHAK